MDIFRALEFRFSRRPDPVDREVQPQHFGGRLDLHHLGAKLAATPAVGFDFPGQLGVTLSQVINRLL
jgi:hypothetical protein